MKTTDSYTESLHNVVEQRAQARRKRGERERDAWLQLARVLRSRGLKLQQERSTGRIRTIDGVNCSGYGQLVDLSFPWSAGGSLGVAGPMRFLVRKDVPGRHRARPSIFREPKDGFDFERIADAVVAALAHRRTADRAREDERKTEASHERALRALKRRAPELVTVLDAFVSVGSHGFDVTLSGVPIATVERVARILSGTAVNR